MNYRERFSTYLLIFIASPLLATSTLCLLCSLTASVVIASPGYEYYGYAPPSNFSALDAHPGAVNFRFGWERNSTSGAFFKSYGHVDNGTCYLDIIGYNDSTHVQIIDVSRPEPVLIRSFTINRMQLYNTTILAKTYFKVVSDKPIAIMVGGGWGYSMGGYKDGPCGFSLFYPSTDGGFAATEFIFMAIHGRGRTERPAPGGTIHALEDAKVTVYDDKGGVVWEKEMKANTTRTVTLLHRTVYRVVSTGRVIVATWSQGTVKAVPSPMGGFKSTYFFLYPDAISAGDNLNDCGAMFIISEDKPCHVKVVDMTNDQTITEKDLNPRIVWFLNSKQVDFVNKPLMIRSTNEVSVMCGAVFVPNPIPTNMEPDVTMIGVRPNAPTTLYVISKAVAFSPKATARVLIGELTITIPQGRYAELPTGLITVSTNSTLIVEIISQPMTTLPLEGDPQPLDVVALNVWGTYLSTTEGVELNYPPPKAAGGEMDVMLYAAVGGVVVVVAVVAVFFLRKPRKK